jgi:hypothetical protein
LANEASNLVHLVRRKMAQEVDDGIQAVIRNLDPQYDRRRVGMGDQAVQPGAQFTPDSGQIKVSDTTPQVSHRWHGKSGRGLVGFQFWSADKQDRGNDTQDDDQFEQETEHNQLIQNTAKPA